MQKEATISDNEEGHLKKSKYGSHTWLDGVSAMSCQQERHRVTTPSDCFTL